MHKSNEQLKTIKRAYGSWLTNEVIAKALTVQVSRVNAWTKYDCPRMDLAMLELLELKLKTGNLTKLNSLKD